MGDLTPSRWTLQFSCDGIWEVCIGTGLLVTIGSFATSDQGWVATDSTWDSKVRFMGY